MKLSSVFYVVLLATSVACSDNSSVGNQSPVSAEEKNAGTVLPAESSTQVVPSPSTFRVGVINAVSLVIQPDSACYLGDKKTGTSARMHLRSDDDGTLTFNFQPDTAGKSRIFLECTSPKGEMNSYSTDLVSSVDVPAVKPAAPKGTLRPALAGDDLSTLTQEQLMQRGYPMRPDPVRNPDAYKTWLEVVSRPMVAISHKPSTLPSEIAQSVIPRQTPNWAGFVNDTATGLVQGLAVTGGWTLPTPQAIYSGLPNEASYWIGIGGYGGGDQDVSGMWQGGVDQLIEPVNGGTVSSAYFWYELITASGPCSTHSVIWHLLINPGDIVLGQLTLAKNGTGTPGVTGGDDSTQYILYYFANLTQGWYLQNNGDSENPFTALQLMKRLNAYKPGCVAGLNGNSAEWIVERMLYPTGSCFPNNGYCPLLNFGTFQMNTAQVFDGASWTWYGFNSQSNVIGLDMTNGTDNLAEVETPSTTTSFEVTWKSYE